MSDAQPPRPARPQRPRRARGLVESLTSIVLGTEAVVVFLGGLTVHGLRALPDPIPSWWGIVGGFVLAVALVISAGLTRYRWGIVLGWAWQGVVLLSALLVPAMALVALVFGGMYAYATIKGAAVDQRRADLHSETSSAPPNGD
ncbi:DUF4233 domain-containing protein [Microbacterium sp. No. 7]|uniref:DUF4233 domain-containing protein n=1 Tax=Microbacterium sp. No. 7 TaxID=1714373 RepID=UPI0006D05FBD|nr:DUF4233 domain-containing protein [Microbacterium sp. No. 7]ALJ20662.1 allophanate hydrolase [Microbacterium sp. No. 7]